MPRLPAQSRNETPENIERVRRLRRDMGVSERVLWEALRNEQTGFRFRRQHPVGPCCLDFYCPEAKLCVEVDGPHHADRQEADARRDEALLALGVSTVRVPSQDLFAPPYVALSGWLKQITTACEERSARSEVDPHRQPPPPSNERGGGLLHQARLNSRPGRPSRPT